MVHTRRHGALHISQGAWQHEDRELALQPPAARPDQDPKFAQETSVLLRAGETRETLRSGLTSKNWVILSGDKGSGKTSYLFFGLKNLAPKLLGIYAPFETPESNFKITCREERDEFLCKHFYAGLISRLGKTIREKLQDKEKKSQVFLRRMIDALVPVEVERTTTRKNERSLLVKLGLRKQPVELGASYGKSIQDEIIERRKEPARPDYAKFSARWRSTLRLPPGFLLSRCFFACFFTSKQ